MYKHRVHVTLVDPREPGMMPVKHTFVGSTEDYTVFLAVEFVKAKQAVDPLLQANFDYEVNRWLASDFTEKSLNMMLNDV